MIEKGWKVITQNMGNGRFEERMERLQDILEQEKPDVVMLQEPGEFQFSSNSRRVGSRESGNRHHLAGNSKLPGPGVSSLEHLIMSLLKISYVQDIERPYAAEEG